LNSHLGSEEATALLKAEVGKGVPEAVKTYLSQGAGKLQLERVVQSQIDDMRVKQIIRDAINETLRSAATSRARSLDANRSKAMIAIATPKVDKGGTPELDEFLRKPEVLAAGRERRPLAIGFMLGRRYVPQVIETYVERTKDRFPGSDVYFVLHNPNGTCLAVCGPVIKDGRHMTRLVEPAGREQFVAEIDRASNPDNFHAARLEELKLKVISARLRATQSLETALRSDVWKNPDDLQEQVAVVDLDQHFLGTTTRELLIAALLES
jgi:hypothetical protein